MVAQSDFERACLPCYGRVLHLCQRMLGSRALAEELAQDTYLKAFEKRASFRGESSVATWVLSIAHRLCLDQIRKPTRELLVQEPRENPVACPEPARLESQELLNRLSPRSRSLLILRAGLELSYAEIGRILEMPVNQVGVYLQRARKEALEIARAEKML